ncbi:MAG TPA: CDP-diacylglycerol--glycerol-3-phosphate 3-phosphatidyltransferase [Gammaproteobacteria bacterium]|nr:CDP-diacylglycerol--glycerol-3-phosphate 3-phosphatidyltransferase [Gammaproteobacteria bacterium]
MRLTLPTAITLCRIALIPLFVIVFYLPFRWVNEAAFAIFALAGFSDWVDGYLARTMQQESPFGAFLDPVADKLMVVVVIVLLVQANPSIYVALPSLIIIAREISVSALREWMAQLGSSASVKVSFIGKAKTMAQMTALGLMIYAEPLMGLPVYDTGLAIYYLAAILTIYSMVIYLRAAWPTLTRDG